MPKGPKKRLLSVQKTRKGAAWQNRQLLANNCSTLDKHNRKKGSPTHPPYHQSWLFNVSQQTTARNPGMIPSYTQ